MRSLLHQLIISEGNSNNALYSAPKRGICFDVWTPEHLDHVQQNPYFITREDPQRSKHLILSLQVNSRIMTRTSPEKHQNLNFLYPRIRNLADHDIDLRIIFKQNIQQIYVTY